MRDPICKYFAVGVLQWMSFPKSDPIESLHKIAEDDFFQAIEVRGYLKEQRREIKRLLEQSHLRVCYGAQPRQLSENLNPNALNEEGRQQAEAALIEAVDEAEYFGASGIAFLAGRWSEMHKEEAYQQLLKTTRNVCTYAAQKKMMIELEAFDYDMDKASLMGPAPLVARFAADMRLTHQNFGVLVDLSHFPTTYEKSEFVVRSLRPYITHLHIGNAVVRRGCDAYGDKHPRFGYPNSANDVDELLDFFRVLKREGFFNEVSPYVLSIEVTPRPDEDENIVLANTKRVIRRAWALLEDE